MSSLTSSKFRDRYHNNSKFPVIIVGENPGRRQNGPDTGVVWQGNRSAKLLNWALEGVEDYILTNICNYQDITEEHLAEGIKDFKLLVRHHHPRMIICLGNMPYKHVSKMDLGDVPISKLPHPSWVARFNKNKEEWKTNLQSLFLMYN